jgi:hypothetical protein
LPIPKKREPMSPITEAIVVGVEILHSKDDNHKRFFIPTTNDLLICEDVINLLIN